MRSVVRLSLPLSLFLCCQATLADSLLVPAPPECVKVLEHPDRGWLVFFDSHNAALTPRASLILKELASVFQEDHGRIMVLNGNTDGAETSPEDLDLGLRRTQAVAAALQQAGIPPSKIYTKDFGTTRPMSGQPPGAPAPQDRRVDLVPFGMWSERSHQAIRTCKATVRATCFGPLTAEQQMLCDHALNILVRAE